MRRFLGRIVHNWPLKLAAVGLATLMYGGLALSQNTQTFSGIIPVRVVNEPPKTVMLPSTPPPVTSVRYFAPSGVPVATSTFLATIDLSGYEGKVGVVSVRIEVTSPDPRVRVLGYVPDYATIELDRLVSLDGVPVKVAHGPVPDGLTLGETKVIPPTVTVSGAASIVAQVDSVRADVVIQSTSIDVDEDVALVPVDKLGNALSPLDVTPPTARVKIPVFADQQTRTLPVSPVITGNPSAGFEIESVTVVPQVALVGGDADRLADMTSIDTEPIPMNGVSEDETVPVDLAPPDGVVVVGSGKVTVSIKLRPVTGTRTYNAGVTLVGDRSDLTYDIATKSVLVTIGGSIAELDRLDGATLVMDLKVAGLGPGTYDIPVTATLPAGTTLVASDPANVKVTITAPPGSSASPLPGGSAGPSPSGG